MENEPYIFIQGEEKEIFIKESTVTSVLLTGTDRATITTNDGEGYIVIGQLAVYALRDHFYQQSKLKLFREKQ